MRELGRWGVRSMGAAIQEITISQEVIPPTPCRNRPGAQVPMADVYFAACCRGQRRPAQLQLCSESDLAGGYGLALGEAAVARGCWCAPGEPLASRARIGARRRTSITLEVLCGTLWRRLGLRHAHGPCPVDR